MHEKDAGQHYPLNVHEETILESCWLQIKNSVGQRPCIWNVDPSCGKLLECLKSISIMKSHFLEQVQYYWDALNKIVHMAIKRGQMPLAIYGLVKMGQCFQGFADKEKYIL